MAGDQHKCTASEEEEEEEEEAKEPTPPDLLMSVGPISGLRLLDAPILLLLLFHKAIKEDLSQLHRFSLQLLDSSSCDVVDSPSHDKFLQLRRRFEFLKLVYKYHSASEDEIIFLALDAHVKNIVVTYSLEHKSIDDLLDSIFHLLDVLVKEDEDIAVPIQQLVSFIDTLQITIFQHMLKEEEQVFPLLVQNFSSKEQVSLVWQFMCSVPVILLQDFWPWMASFFSLEERVNAIYCIKAVVPTETLLQEVVISWFDEKKQNPFHSDDRYAKGALFLHGPANYQKILELYKSESYCSVHTTGKYNPVDGVHLWHGAFRKDLGENLHELYQIRSSNNFSRLLPTVVQLNFLADVLIFYSNALDKIFYPMCTQFAEDCPAPSIQQFLDDTQIEGLQRLLYYKAESVQHVRHFVHKLCTQLEKCVLGIDGHLKFLETKIFPYIGLNCNQEMQHWLLHTSLEMMPLGLLKCTTTWFSTHLSEVESKSILFGIKEGSLSTMSLSPLLYEWLRTGYLGKSSIKKFRNDLLGMFNYRCSYLFEQIKHECVISDSELDTSPLNTFSAAKGEICVSSSSSSGSTITKKHNMSYSSGMNFHVFFPQALKMLCPVSKLLGDDKSSSSILYLESRPVDHILLFHKVLKKDLEHLVNVSSNLAQNDAFLEYFHQRFRLIRLFYPIHSDSEDKVAFPALEAKGKTQNISHSYSMDHKLEIEHFNRISFILDQISELHVPVSGGGLDAQDGRNLKYRQLCVKLHNMCKCMNKILCDHINHEEIELWPLFREEFSIEEQENIIGSMLGRIRAEILEEMIPWLMESLTPEEQHALVSVWRNATKNTMFDQWLGEWWDGMKRYETAKIDDTSIPPPWTESSLEDLSTYLFKEDIDDPQRNLCDKDGDQAESNVNACKMLQVETLNFNDKEEVFRKNENDYQSHACQNLCSEVAKKKGNKITEVADQAEKPGKSVHISRAFTTQRVISELSQTELEASIRRVSRDSTLDPQKRSLIIQNLLTSRWIGTQMKPHPEAIAINNEQEVPGQCPSYRDPLKLEFGCQHYKRNCKLVAACCNMLYTCRICHDDERNRPDDKSAHSMDRKATTKMMCMKCLVIQPIGQACTTVSCNNLYMARYHCKICKLFDDERKIYHCPYCNLCRVGKGLGIDYFHCMNCNACMSTSLSVHICREKCFMDNCPICHEYIFTSSSPVKALPCGHLMHSSCFQDYTCSNYTCPICSKSLGDMQVYFGMLDALLAEEKIPDEYSGKTQVILCNDCEKRGSSTFHWLYHKCSHCGSYNTRLL